ncbi:MAG: nitroreductase family protein [Chloroflexi bacterium]|nr:nitroreductase family protein [Chloroflexota bacterium]
METFQAIYERRSIRSFVKGKVIPGDTKDKILDAARYSLPTPTGDYPWRLLVAKEESTKQLVARCAEEVARVMFGTSYEVFEQHLWYMPPETRLRVAEYTTTGELWTYPETCDMLVIPILCKSDWACGLGGLLRAPEYVAPYLGFPTQNMWLAAHSLGVGAGYNGMPMLDARRREIISNHLGIPPTWDATGGFAFGYAANPRISGPSRPPLEGIAFSEYWANPWVRAAFRGGAGRVELPQMNIMDAIVNLRTVKSFKERKLEDLVIEKILDTALWGPVPENFKQWRYIVIRDRASKEFLRRLVEERRHMPFYFNDPEWQHARTWYLKEEERMEAVERTMESGIGEWYTQADTLIMVMGGRNWADSAHIANVAFCRNPIPGISTACCVQNMMIAATAMGLGVNFDPTPIYDIRMEESVREFFGVPTAWVILGVLAIGEPGEKAERPPIPSLDWLVYEDYWGVPYKGAK